MPKPPTTEVRQVIQGTPILNVKNPRETSEYYRDVLGFEFDYAADGYAVVWRDNAAIHFAEGEEVASGVKLFLWVKNADEVYGQLVKNGANITVDIADREYGIRDFGIADCNGLELVVGQDIA